MGQIVKLYMDWTMSGDDAWLRQQWPAAKRALAYAWRPGGWDERKSGVMDGVQHNTYDVEFYGPNPMCSTWYLAALRASSRMAEAMGDRELAAECTRMSEQGSQWIDQNLFNGEYYIQQVRGIPLDKIASGLRVGMGSKDTMQPVFQVGGGCFVDQLVGQYMATVAGLGDLLDPAHIRTTLASILRYNYKRSLAHHASVERTYVLDDEAALVIVDYSKSSPPKVPLPYHSEAWSGLEYSTAALMMAHGMVEEGIEIVRNTRSRYDGEKRNPYDETEYGRHYARAMSSWAPIPVLSGFRYDGRAQRIDFAPLLKSERFQSFWSAPAAWGNIAIDVQGLTLSVKAGTLPLKELGLQSNHSFKMVKLQAISGERPVTFTVESTEGGTTVRFSPPIEVDAKRPLRIRQS
jgi:uncharacterized protein (DUF608 family)